MIHLGNKGYALNEYLITPLAHPNTDQERNFNSAHTRTRATLERCIGLLKGRWMSIGSAGGTLLYSPEKTCNIILACGVLHNIALACSQMTRCSGVTIGKQGMRARMGPGQSGAPEILHLIYYLINLINKPLP